MEKSYKKLSLIIAGAMLASLIGCTAAQQASVSGDLAKVQAACNVAAPVVGVASTLVGTISPTNASTVNSLVGFEQSVCSSAANMAATAANSSGSSTAVWIQNIVGGILQAAPVIMSMVP